MYRTQTISDMIYSESRNHFRNHYEVWRTVSREVDHAFWNVWNPKYGPLNVSQREYGLRLICEAIHEAQLGDKPIALFLYLLRQTYNHEDTDAEFKRLRDEQEMSGVDGLVGSI